MTSDRKIKEMGDFLRVRRSEIRPEEVNLPARKRARTAGLRREDVASLAGVSTSWYTWLEQGRDVSVSSKVLLNIARALRLSSDQIDYLFDLAGRPRPLTGEAPTTLVPDALKRLLAAIPYPAYILNERWDRIAWNDATLALLGDFSEASLLQRNVVWRACLDAETRSLTPDWRETARVLVAEFQAETSRYINAPWMIEFVDLMSRESEEFRTAWERRDVVQRRRKINIVRHPEAGEMHFEHISLHPADGMNLMLSTFIPIAPDDVEARLARAIALLNEQRERQRSI